MIKKSYRGFKFFRLVSSLDDFAVKFKVSERELSLAGAGEDYDTNVIKRILKKRKGSYLVSFFDTGGGDGYWVVYKK